jgi:hypothetical protein
MTNESYNIYRDGCMIGEGLTRDEIFDMMEDLSVEFYQTGFPSPESIKTEIIEEN